MKKNTPARAKSSTPKRDTSANAARRLLAIEPTEADKHTARQLAALYKSKDTPDLIKTAIFRLFWDTCQHYGVNLPANFTSKWIPFWPLLLARVRRNMHAVTGIRYTYEPTPEQEAIYELEEKEEADTRAIFDLCHNDAIRPDVRRRFADEVQSILDAVPIADTWKVFSVAWPLALESLNVENDEDDSEK
jgi:hypothetical protein